MHPTTRLSLLKVFASFLGIALLLRWPGFFPSVIDHDESTYIVIADAIRAGKLYYVEVMDNKPIGIFLLFAAIQKLFGTSIVIIRLAAACWIAATAFLLYLAHERFQSSKEAGWAAGFIYIGTTSVFTFFGVSPNTEIFFNLFTVAALVLLLPNPARITTLAAGFLLGIGFLIKYVVVFDAIAFSLILAWLHWKKGALFLFQTGLLLVLGFCIPFGSMCLYYWNAGYLDRVLYFTFELSYKYVSNRDAGSFFLFVLDLFARFLPVSIWFFFAFFKQSKATKELKVMGGIWSAIALLTVVLPGKLFYHYFIQFLPPFALMAGSFFDKKQAHGKFWNYWLRLKTGGTLLALLVVINTAFQINDHILKPDRPREVAAWLKKHMDVDDIVYTGNYQQIIYHLLDESSPTPYIHRSLLTNKNNLFALGTDHNAEMQKILDQEPDYIIIEDKYEVLNSILHKELTEEYELVKEFEGDIKIYEREEDSP